MPRGTMVTFTSGCALPIAIPRPAASIASRSFSPSPTIATSEMSRSRCVASQRSALALDVPKRVRFENTVLGDHGAVAGLIARSGSVSVSARKCGQRLSCTTHCARTIGSSSASRSVTTGFSSR